MYIILLCLSLSGCNGIGSQINDQIKSGGFGNINNIQISGNINSGQNQINSGINLGKNIKNFIDSGSILHYKGLYSIYIPSNIVDKEYLDPKSNKIDYINEFSNSDGLGNKDDNNIEAMYFSVNDINKDISTKDICYEYINKYGNDFDVLNSYSKLLKGREIFIVQGDSFEGGIKRANLNICFLDNDYVYTIRHITQNPKSKNMERIISSFKFIDR